jgi:hypothetical protein
MWGHIERYGLCANQCSGCVRIFEDGQEFGEAYTYAFPFREIEPGVIHLHGIVKRAPTVSEAKAMLIACRDAGLTVNIERKSGRMIGTRTITRGPYSPKQ